MTYTLVEHDHEVLHKKLDDFDFNNPPVDPEVLAKDLYDFMKENNGLGLAANQVGLEHRVCVINCEPVLAMYNPEIVYYNSKHNVLTEGCLSQPNLIVRIRRPQSVRVRYYNASGELITKVFEGMMARVVQHEIDHLNGIDYTDRASDINLKNAKRKYKLMRRTLNKLERLADLL